MSKKWKRILLIGAPVLLILVIVLAKVGLFGGDDAQVVEYVIPEKRNIVETITASGRIQPVSVVKLSPEVSGEITELPIIEGQAVKKGDLLVRIKPDSYLSMRARAEAGLNSSLANLQQVKASLAQVKRDFARAEQLYEQQAVSEAEYQSAKTKLAMAESDALAAQYAVENSRAALKEAGQSLAKTVIYAPIDATVSRLSVELGERVVGTATMAGTELLQLADLTRMEARVDVSESDVVNVHKGDTAIVHVDAYPDTVFRGVVTQVANTAALAATNDQMTTFEVRILLIRESYAYLDTIPFVSPFKPGMSVSVDIQTRMAHQALSIPIECVTLKREGKYQVQNEGLERQEVVFEVRNDTARMVEVTTGIQDAKFIAIAQGLSDSAKVVAAPYSAVSRSLADGDRVIAKKQKEKGKSEQAK